MHFTEGEKYGGYRIREIQMTTSEKYMFINLAAACKCSPTFSSAKPFSTNFTFKLTVRNCSLIGETFVIRNIEHRDFSEPSSRELKWSFEMLDFRIPPICTYWGVT